LLKDIFIQLIASYTNDNKLVNKLWQEIETNYTHKKRHYHTLTHLENLYIQLFEIKHLITNWQTILFSLFYHDVIYNTLNQNNEEQSAILAEKRMKEIFVPTSIIENCKSQILATKSHTFSNDADTNYFTDADLSILGKPWNEYAEYYKNVRKEYSIYPSLIYNPGRKKVLQHFITMNKIYKTEYFYSKFEEQAKQNLQAELELLK
jgi:predicted metal-dependent HD superfamily phosphohydrolase